MWHTTLITALGRQRQVDFREFEASKRRKEKKGFKEKKPSINVKPTQVMTGI